MLTMGQMTGNLWHCVEIFHTVQKLFTLLEIFQTFQKRFTLIGLSKLWKTIKTNLELYRVVMCGSCGYRRRPGGSDHFSLQTNRHFIIIYISSSLICSSLSLSSSFSSTPDETRSYYQMSKCHCHQETHLKWFPSFNSSSDPCPISNLQYNVYTSRQKDNQEIPKNL